MVIEERPKDANRGQRRPLTSHTRRRSGMRAARRRNFVDRARSIWHESRSARTMTTVRAVAQFRDVPVLNYNGSRENAV